MTESKNDAFADVVFEPKPENHQKLWTPKLAPKIMDTILENIGNTPLVRINKLTTQGEYAGIKCEVLAKCEFFNSGGSVKDRIGRQMVEDAESSGRIKKGDTLIEPTSGNTGIGLALAAAIKGYRMIITLPEKMSQEKVDVLKALGAEIIRTPTEAAFDSPESHIGVAKRLNKELPNSHILDQYSNPSNPMAHILGTGLELCHQTDNKIDYMFISAGTGGTLTGISTVLKKKCPGIKIIGVDPNGSILAQPESLNGPIVSYKVEGIGYDFIPKVLDRSLVDEWVKTDDAPSFQMARRMIKEEGLLCGGSCGSTMYAALRYIKKHNIPAGKRCVVLLADSVRNYMSKFLNDGWMRENGWLKDDEKVKRNTWWSNKNIAELKLPTPVTVRPGVSCKECLSILRDLAIDQMPVVSKDGTLNGVVSTGNLTSYISSGRAKPSDEVMKVAFQKFKKMTLSSTLGDLSEVFNKSPYALVESTQVSYAGEGEKLVTKMLVGVVTRIDLLNYIMEGDKTQPSQSKK